MVTARILLRRETYSSGWLVGVNTGPSVRTQDAPRGEVGTNKFPMRAIAKLGSPGCAFVATVVTWSEATTSSNRSPACASISVLMDWTRRNAAAFSTIAIKSSALRLIAIARCPPCVP